VKIKGSPFVNRLIWPADKEAAVRLLQAQWEKKWRSPSRAPWADRPVPAEVIEAVETGWLPKAGRMLELGCGTAGIAAWFAERGYQATGVDIARAALDRAAEKYAYLSPAIEFIAVDLCTETLSDRSFDILIDRGCLHQIPRHLVADYVRNISSVAAPSAKLLLFMKAFRGGRSFGDDEETGLRTDWTRSVFAGHFDLERARPTHLNPGNSEDPLPGIAFWLSRHG